MSLQKFRKECELAVKQYLKKSRLEKPPKEIDADLAMPCFTLAKHLKKSPAEIAEELAGKLKPKGLIKKIAAIGPYVNFYADWDSLCISVTEDILKENEKYGSAASKGKKEKIMIEYSAPNSNKPLHVGHLRNDSIGMSIANILAFSGKKVIKANLVNDRGIHICKVMAAYKHFGKKPDKKSDHFIGDLYVLYHKKGDELKEEAYDMLKKWEAKDNATIALWKKINEWAIKGIKETYKSFGSEFDVWFFESEFYDKAKPLIENAIRKKVFFRDADGTIFARLEPYLPNKVVLRSDGTSTYITNDLPLTKHKFDSFKINKSIWVVASEQNLYFKQLFTIFSKLGYKWSKNCYHLSYGLVNLPSGKMKSREGTVIDADDLIEEVIEMAKKEIKQRYPGIDNKELETRARDIALGAIKYYLLKVEPVRDLLFEPHKAVAFEGDTGPYLQYTHARASSIINKSDKKPKAGKLKEEHEINLIKKLSTFHETIERCSKELKPHYLANYLSELANMFNEYYHNHKVIGSDNEQARLALTLAVKIVMNSGLKLLGIKPLEKM